jgi:hypothetical protein
MVVTYIERRYQLGMDAQQDPDRLMATVLHHFRLDGKGFWLTTNLATEFVQVRASGPACLLVLYRHGDPANARFCVAEMDGSDTGGRHVHDHGPDLAAAVRDFQTRQPDQMTAVPPEPVTKS